MSKVQVIAHRGLRMEIPENTLPSIEAALSVGVQGVEFDVELTLDHVPVILHQRTLEPGEKNQLKLGENSFKRCWVQESTLSEIKAYDAGSWFSDRFKGVGLPTFEEISNLDWGNVCVFSELSIPHGLEEPEKLRKEMLSAISPIIDSVLAKEIQLKVLSFDWEMLGLVRSYYSEIPLILNVWSGFTGDHEAVLKICRKHKIQTVDLPFFILLEDPSWVECFHKAEIEVFSFNFSPDVYYDKSWTAAGQEKDWQRLIDIGVDGIITDFPKELLAFL